MSDPAIPTDLDSALEAAMIQKVDEGEFDRGCVPDDPKRLAVRVEAAAPTPEPEERRPRPPADPNVEWSAEPSMPEQMQRHPASVRMGAPFTAILNLSKTEDLAELNRVQALCHEPRGARAVITEKERQFYEGAWHVILTYAPIQYQKI